MVSPPAGLGEGYARLASTGVLGGAGGRPFCVGAFALGGLTVTVS